MKHRNFGSIFLYFMIVLTAFFLIGFAFYYSMQMAKEKLDQEMNKNKDIIQQQQAELVSLVGETSTGSVIEASEDEQCVFPKELPTNASGNYGIFGDAEYETYVCGYVTSREEKIFDQEVTTAALVITEFSDENFKNEIAKGLQEGNTVNKNIEGAYAFNLGCLEDGVIKGEQYGADEYIDADTLQVLQETSVENQRVFKIGLGIHAGRGCVCCNLGHTIRAVQ